MSAIADLRNIARALGGEVVSGQVVAPGPNHSRRDRSMTVRLSPTAPEGFVVFSHSGDDFAECRDYVRERLGLERDAPAASQEARWQASALQPQIDDENAKTRAYAARIVREAHLIIGTSGEAYLRESRRIDTSAVVDVLGRLDAIGWHPAVRFNEPDHALHGQRLGVIVGVMTDVATAAPTGAISRTYIGADGAKVGKAKTLGSPAGIVRLSHDEDVCGGLFIAEGLETALSAIAIGLRPMWSTGSTALMASFPPLAGIEALTIIADHDESGTGLRAAETCATAWRKAGKEVRILMRDRSGDLNDAIREAAA